MLDVARLRVPDGVVPRGFDAVVDALRGGGSVTAAVQEIGSRAAREGSSLDDVLIDLEATYLAVHDLPVEPPFDVVRALAVSWADASLRYLHAVSCEDPLTGLASLAHVRTRIIEIYREAARRGALGSPGGALLVVEIDWRDSHASHLDRMLRLIDMTEILRTFSPVMRHRPTHGSRVGGGRAPRRPDGRHGGRTDGADPALAGQDRPRRAALARGSPQHPGVGGSAPGRARQE